jgi:DNA-binding GntR family transcriptional regulator
VIQRKPLRAEVQQEILNRIVDGRLPERQRINETHLATELGVSRTPLREAMLGLEAGGFLISDLGRGFQIPELSPSEFSQIQSVLGHLEPLALLAAPPLDGRRIADLNNLLGRSRLAAQRGGREGIAAMSLLILRWSVSLTATCANRVLADQIHRLEGLANRYWFAAFAGGLAAEPLFASLEEIYHAVRTGDLPLAGKLWGTHIERFAGLATPVIERESVGELGEGGR